MSNSREKTNFPNEHVTLPKIIPFMLIYYKVPWNVTRPHNSEIPRCISSGVGWLLLKIIIRKKYVSGMHQSIPDLTQFQSLSIDCFNLES